MNWQYVEMTEKADPFYKWYPVSEGDQYIQRKYIAEPVTYVAALHFETANFRWIQEHTVVNLSKKLNKNLDEFLYIPDVRFWRRQIGENNFGIAEVLEGFIEWTQNFYYERNESLSNDQITIVGASGNRNTLNTKDPLQLFTSHEAMWQAYYMQRIHNRIWNGEDYIERGK